MDETLRDALARTAAELETHLDHILPRWLPGGGQRLCDAMRYAVMGGGKRLRAFLVIEGTRLCGGDTNAAWRAAAAVECLHAYSLVHDDLPAMDNDDLRRGRPTVHRAFDEATAILAGDALLTHAFHILANPETHPDGDVRAELCLALARGAGAMGMVGGQMLDLAAEGRWPAISQDKDLNAVRQIQGLKTGALIMAAAEMGPIIADDRPARAAMRVYGQALGLAFQIADDLLDLEGSREKAGKAVGKDAALGKATLPSLMGIEAARAEARAQAERAVRALEQIGGDAALLEALAFFAIERDS